MNRFIISALIALTISVSMPASAEGFTILEVPGYSPIRAGKLVVASDLLIALGIDAALVPFLCTPVMTDEVFEENGLKLVAWKDLGPFFNGMIAIGFLTRNSVEEFRSAVNRYLLANGLTP